MGVSAASTGKPAGALGAMPAAGSAAGPGYPAARRKVGRRVPVGPLHLVVRLLGSRDGAQPQRGSALERAAAVPGLHAEPRVHSPPTSNGWRWEFAGVEPRARQCQCQRSADSSSASCLRRDVTQDVPAAVIDAKTARRIGITGGFQIRQHPGGADSDPARVTRSKRQLPGPWQLSPPINPTTDFRVHPPGSAVQPLAGGKCRPAVRRGPRRVLGTGMLLDKPARGFRNLDVAGLGELPQPGESLVRVTTLGIHQ